MIRKVAFNYYLPNIYQVEPVIKHKTEKNVLLHGATVPSLMG